MARVVRSAACLLVAAMVVLGMVANANMATPPGTSLFGKLERIWAGMTAYVDLRILGPDRQLHGAREWVQLDPQLDGLGHEAALVLATRSPDLVGERFDHAIRLAAIDPRYDALPEGILRGALEQDSSPIEAFKVAADRLPEEQRTRILALLSMSPPEQENVDPRIVLAEQAEQAERVVKRIFAERARKAQQPLADTP